MPLYEYTCTGCQDDFEILLRDGETPVCPGCGGARLEKKFSVPAAHVHGGSSLPMAGSSGGGCGRPRCGQGGCGAM